MNRLALLLLAMSVASAHGAVLYVGPGMPYDTPSKVALVAIDGDTIEIEAADYSGDVAVWTQNNLVIRGVGGRPHIRAANESAEGKAIWVIKGNDTVVENIEFSGARVADRNGAGIRLEGTNLTVRNCYFHHNENGILTGADAASEVLVEYSEFSNNGYGDGYSHNMYIGRIARFSLRFSYSHHARTGHQVKSRAAENYIMFNRLMDEVSGTSSYLIDLPNPGSAYVVGNELQQGPSAENWAMLHVSQKLHLINNTFVNDRGNGQFVRFDGETENSLLQNNIFAGQGLLETHGAKLISNVVAKNAGLVSRVGLDYRLTQSSPAVDAGSPLDEEFTRVAPVSEYVHPARGEKRRSRGRIDAGAHEYHPDG
jgi:Right handed beta helix region